MGGKMGKVGLIFMHMIQKKTKVYEIKIVKRIEVGIIGISILAGFIRERRKI